jgi:hypothetical protein
MKEPTAKNPINALKMTPEASTFGDPGVALV